MIVAHLSPAHQTRASALSPIRDNRGGWSPYIREPFTGAWQRNMEWTNETVLAHQAVYVCVSRISQDVGKLRPKLVEEYRPRLWRETENGTHSPTLSQPNRYQNYLQFGEWWTTSKLIHGNTYALKERDNRGGEFQGSVRALYILDPTRVTPMVSPDGEVFYQLKADNLAGLTFDEIAVPASEIVHDRMNCLFHPLVGTSPIFAAGQAAYLGLKIEESSTGFHANGANPSGILTSALPITKQQAKEMTELWAAQYSGVNSGGVAVLGGGLQFQQMRMSAVESQMIEQLKWTSEVICSVFHVPAWKVGVGEQPAYTKPEIANHAYYSDCLHALIEQYELCLDEALGLRKPVGGRRLGVELDLDGLLRMDQASQIESLTKASGGAIMTPDEARLTANLPPIPGGDQLWKQQQDHSLKALAERDRNDPFAKPTPAPALPPAQDPDEPEDPPAEEEETEDERIAARLRLRASRRARTFRMRTAA